LTKTYYLKLLNNALKTLVNISLIIIPQCKLFLLIDEMIIFIPKKNDNIYRKLSHIKKKIKDGFKS